MRKPQATEETTNVARREMEQDCFGRDSAETASLSTQKGYGSSFAHHGEILQGMVEEGGGRLRHGLVSLRCKIFSSEATFVPDGGSRVVVAPHWKVKARRAAELTLARFRQNCRGGRLFLRSNIPPCWGLGSSTSDVTATIQAVADILGLNLSAEVVADLSVQAEVASDSTMFDDRAVLFAFRDGYVIEDFGGRFPPLEVLGFNTDITGAGVDTLSYPLALYTSEEIEALRPLVELLRQAVRAQDPRLIGEAASASARINQRRLPKCHYDYLEKLVERVGALGLQVAHSGTVAGLLFDPQAPEVQEQIGSTRALLAEVGIVSIWRFQTYND
jgi:uncharacterized protein involved in propanediol utilization